MLFQVNQAILCHSVTANQSIKFMVIHSVYKMGIKVILRYVLVMEKAIFAV